MKKIKNRISILISLIISAVLLSGCSILPELPEENVTFVSLDGKYQLTASNDWEKNPDTTLDIGHFGLYSDKKNNTFYAFVEEHIIYTAFTFENYCNIRIKDWFCDELDIIFPETYTEESVLGKTARWYEGHDLVDNGDGDKYDYYCCITEIGEKDSEKTYFVSYGFVESVDEKVKAEILDMLNSFQPVSYER